MVKVVRFVRERTSFTLVVYCLYIFVLLEWLRISSLLLLGVIYLYYRGLS
ncbi:MAG: hypothetical protein QW534_04345 [Candidatus Methanomethylicia archaeon]